MMPFRSAMLGGLLPTPVPAWANVRLLLHGSGADGSTSFTDYSSSARTVSTFGNAQMDTGIDIYGTSMLFDGTGDYLTVPHNADLQVGTSTDFCVEAWIRLSAAKEHTIVSKRDSGGAEEFSFTVNAAGYLQFATFNIGAQLDCPSTSPVISTGTTYHVAGSRQGTTGRIFVNGQIVGTATQSGTVSGNTGPLHIGRNAYNTSRDAQGSMNWVRLTIGEALYTSNFTPPSPPLPTS